MGYMNFNPRLHFSGSIIVDVAYLAPVSFEGLSVFGWGTLVLVQAGPLLGEILAPCLAPGLMYVLIMKNPSNIYVKSSGVCRFCRGKAYEILIHAPYPWSHLELVIHCWSDVVLWSK